MKEGRIDGNGVDNDQLREMITSAKKRLYDKLIHLDPKSLEISEYNQRYIGSKIPFAEATLELYGELLYLALEDNQIPPTESALVDYGGGSGLIALLACEIGIGPVIYNDIYDVSCKDVKKLSSALGLKLEHVVPGDVEDLVLYLKQESIAVDAIVSNDVLEHIYDLESHFRILATLGDHPYRVVYATGANIRNKRYTKEARKKQIEVEHLTREAQWGHKERDTLQAYLDVRRDLISAYAPDMAPSQVGMLARSTRGLIKSDIEKCVVEFRQEGTISYQPDHPTNTCDPLTGNWCEHLMEFDWMERTIKSAGFSVSIIPGSYFVSGSLLKRNAKILLNSMLRLFGRRCMFLAPYFVIIAEAPPSRRGSPNLVSAPPL